MNITSMTKAAKNVQQSIDAMLCVIYTNILCACFIIKVNESYVGRRAKKNQLFPNPIVLFLRGSLNLIFGNNEKRKNLKNYDTRLSSLILSCGIKLLNFWRAFHLQLHFGLFIIRLYGIAQSNRKYPGIFRYFYPRVKSPRGQDSMSSIKQNIVRHEVEAQAIRFFTRILGNFDHGFTNFIVILWIFATG